MDRIKQAYDLGFKYEREYYGCAQCILLAIQDVFGLENEAVFKSASGLAAGIGLMGSICGALTGGVMALSLKYGRDLQAFKAGDPEGKRLATYEKARKLYKHFEDEYGSFICRDIQKKTSRKRVKTYIYARATIFQRTIQPYLEVFFVNKNNQSEERRNLETGHYESTDKKEYEWLYENETIKKSN